MELLEVKLWRMAHQIRCDSSVPSEEYLNINTSATSPYVDVAFVNSATLTANGPLTANGEHGEVRFFAEVHEQDNDVFKEWGMWLTGELKMMNGGQIRIYDEEAGEPY